MGGLRTFVTESGFLNKILQGLQIVGIIIGAFIVLRTTAVEGTGQW